MTTKKLAAASLVIRDAPAMTKKGRKDIAKWLRRQADDLEEMGHEYNTKAFYSRYWFEAP